MGGRAAAERWRKAHPKRAREIRRKAAAVWRNKHPDHAKAADRAKHLLKKYGLTIPEWEQRFNIQGNRCAVCGSGTGPWATDHDHITGKLRDILCLQCNTDLGLIEDRTRVTLLQTYLEKWL
jgi:hypothetical protein